MTGSTRCGTCSGSCRQGVMTWPRPGSLSSTLSRSIPGSARRARRWRAFQGEVRVTEAAESKHGEARRPDPVWLVAIAALALLFLAVSVQKIWAGDFWGQLRTGQLILERGALPHA